MVVLRGIFQAKAEVLTIGCKDNMFSIKVTLSGGDLQLAMTCSHSVKNIGHRPLVKNSVKNIQLIFIQNIKHWALLHSGKNFYKTLDLCFHMERRMLMKIIRRRSVAVKALQQMAKKQGHARNWQFLLIICIFFRFASALCNYILQFSLTIRILKVHLWYWSTKLINVYPLS